MDETLHNYKTLVDIFKGYLDTVVTVHTTYYAFTGAITAYYLAHPELRSVVRFSLWIPFFLGLALAIASSNGRAQALTLKNKVNEVVTNLAMDKAPPVDILRHSLMILGILDVIICVGLLLLIIWPRLLFGDAG